MNQPASARPAPTTLMRAFKPFVVRYITIVFAAFELSR
jgi:hypothetical protein